MPSRTTQWTLYYDKMKVQVRAISQGDNYNKIIIITTLTPMMRPKIIPNRDVESLALKM